MQEVVPGDIWSVTFLSARADGAQNSRTRAVYVLEATCEVIGNPLQSQNPEVNQLTLPLRADWSAYVDSQINTIGNERLSLLSQLKWTHFAEYERGISRLWLARMAKEGEEGTEKRRVAERYVFASVIANR